MESDLQVQNRSDEHNQQGAIRWTICILTCFILIIASQGSQGYDLKNYSFEECYSVALVASFWMYAVMLLLPRWLTHGKVDIRSYITNASYVFIIIYLMALMVAWTNLPDCCKMLQLFSLMIAASILNSLWQQAMKDNVPIEINSDFKDMSTIGEVWANSCICSYYSEVFKDFTERIQNFEKHRKLEENKDFVIKLKKMIIFIPLSCDASNTLDKKYPHFTYIDDLAVHTDVQGGNINREYKNPVYRISSDGDEALHLCVEQPNTLVALYKYKKTVSESIWKFQRDEFISTLRYRLKDQPCIILVYDDMKEQKVPLNEFIIEEVKKLLESETEKGHARNVVENKRTRMA